MKVLNSISILLIVQIVLIHCRLQPRSQFSCAIGFNYAQIQHVSISLYKNVEEKVFFYLYTKENPDGEEITINEEILKSSKFNSSRPTKIITHGYWSKGEGESCALPRDAFLKAGDYNVIVVDWWKMESILNVPVVYAAACKSVPIVAEYLARFVNFLESQGMSLGNTAMVGHSLGAHIMGLAASQTKSKVQYIVGLDPALPKFEDKDPSERLSPDDAETVYVIHTNEGDCGISQPIGHYDFYPNGGNEQPGCLMNACAHSRSFELYAESIHKDNKLYGYFCADLDSARAGNCDGDMVQMRDDLRFENVQEGIYYLKTGKATPFGLGP